MTMTTAVVEEVLKAHWPISQNECRCKAKFPVTSLLREHIAKVIASGQ